MNASPMAVQAAAYKIILDRMVGQHALHDKVAIVCAGNKTTDKAIVNRLSTAMQSRLIHFELIVDFNTWINWAIDNNIDDLVINYIRFRPEILHKFDPSHSDNTFPCPRTWHFLSDMIKNIPDLNDNYLELIAGTIGEGAAYEFLEFIKIYNDLPSIDEIIRNPETVHISEEPSTRYAISTLLSKNATMANIPQLMKLVNRLPVEFQIISLRSTMKKNKALLKEPSVQEWIKMNAKELI